MKSYIAIIFIVLLTGCVNQHLVNAKQSIINAKYGIKTAKLAQQMASTDQDYNEINNNLQTVICISIKDAHNELTKVSKQDLSPKELIDFTQANQELSSLMQNNSVSCSNY